MPQLPATLKPGALTTPADTHLVPALIADAGEPAGWRYVEFFTANIRNPNTRRAYARACGRFFAWCEDRGLTLTTIRPFDVATYIETLPADPFGARREAAARRGAHAVRLADHRPGRARQSGLGRARAEACGEDRQDAGARRQGMAQADRRHPDRHGARSARPGADRHPHLFLRAHRRGAEDEGRGSPAEGRRAG